DLVFFIAKLQNFRNQDNQYNQNLGIHTIFLISTESSFDCVFSLQSFECSCRAKGSHAKRHEGSLSFIKEQQGSKTNSEAESAKARSLRSALQE
ncbi:MAG: hypothetical protein K2L22_12795, partial [Muribaculaceae bacterium]|nr:hypothetical protein [Muribaculaceae bacterium]